MTPMEALWKNSAKIRPFVVKITEDPIEDLSDDKVKSELPKVVAALKQSSRRSGSAALARGRQSFSIDYGPISCLSGMPRKGAIRAGHGELGISPGSMGSKSLSCVAWVMLPRSNRHRTVLAVA